MEERLAERDKQTDEITLKTVILKLNNFYFYLISKIYFIIFFSLVCGFIGLLYGMKKKPVYTASTTFVLEDADKGAGGLGQLSGVASMAGIDLGNGAGGVFQGDNILQLYNSRTMIEKTLFSVVDYKGKKELLIDIYIDFNKLRTKWSEEPELMKVQFKPASDGSPTRSFSRLQDSIIGTIVDDINKNALTIFKPDKKLSILQTSVKSTDEFFAKAFDEKIVENVNKFYVETKTKKSLANIAILQHKTDSVRNIMNGAIYTAAVISDNTPNLNTTRQTQRTAPIQRSQFSAEVNRGVLSELVKNLELSKISLLKETPLIQIIDNPVLPLQKKNLGMLKGLIIGIVVGLFLACLYFFILKSLKAIMA